MAVLERPDTSRARNDGPEHTPRLWLKRKAPVTGYVDGAWWPHSPDLADELPDLLAVLSVRLGSVERVSYRLGDWSDTPRKLVVGGQAVKLDGYRRQPANTVGVSDGRGQSILLLVIPPQTDPDQAHLTALAAAATDDASSVESLLATAPGKVVEER
ncbi:hypothetical protein JRC04_16790 [Mycolicibacterium sp. S2-37]|uniref:DUF5994 family protein n=1 Tax=Mycolicibacterium sp. S2-37 TaxID=2810297 RepID=UPI001A94D3F7|nr:DUF5994 family protein [Mycolicibacterium sp. S2-37]MBO0679123.1 hypothetical protein [Mycolicibacterium sp. S2-37]